MHIIYLNFMSYNWAEAHEPVNMSYTYDYFFIDIQLFK